MKYIIKHSVGLNRLKLYMVGYDIYGLDYPSIIDFGFGHGWTIAYLSFLWYVITPRFPYSTVYLTAMMFTYTLVSICSCWLCRELCKTYWICWVRISCKLSTAQTIVAWSNGPSATRQSNSGRPTATHKVIAPMGIIDYDFDHRIIYWRRNYHCNCQQGVCSFTVPYYAR